MDFLTQNALYIELQDKSALEADEKLLKSLKKEASSLHSKFFDDERKGKEILWQLIEVASKEEILENRGKGKKNEVVDPKTKEEIKTRIAELEQKLEDNTLQPEEEANIHTEINLLHDKLDALMQIDPGKLISIHETLLKANLNKLDQKELKSIVLDLKIEPKDFKAKTLRKVLNDYILTIREGEENQTSGEFQELPNANNTEKVSDPVEKTDDSQEDPEKKS